MTGIKHVGTAICLMLCVTAAQASVITAENVTDPPYDIGLSFGGMELGSAGHLAQGQSFLALESGPLESISVYVSEIGSAVDPIRVKIRANAGGLPGATLGEALIPFPTSIGMATADFTSQSIPISSGTSYFLTVSTDTPVFGSQYIVAANAPNLYPSGFPVYSNPDNGLTWQVHPDPLDIIFRVRVVPEPAAAGLLLGLFLLKRRRQAR